jgi:hypothetical protein
MPAITVSICGASVMADKKEEHTAHSVASKIAKALLKVKPESKQPRKKRRTK